VISWHSADIGGVVVGQSQLGGRGPRRESPRLALLSVVVSGLAALEWPVPHVSAPSD
jgi:hypothetical protein